MGRRRTDPGLSRIELDSAFQPVHLNGLGIWSIAVARHPQFIGSRFQIPEACGCLRRLLRVLVRRRKHGLLRAGACKGYLELLRLLHGDSRHDPDLHRSFHGLLAACMLLRA